MPFQKFLNDRVALIKKDGRRFDNLAALVESDMIFTNDPQIPIEDGDRFERRLPSGVVEHFLILDAGFMQEFRGVPAHYQSKVRKDTGLTGSRPSTQVVYNLIGPNTRVNIQSADSSTNVVNVETSDLFDVLQRTISEAIQDPVLNERLRQSVEAMQSSAGTRGFSERYKDFIALAADHITIFAPFLPALTQLLL